MTRNHIRTTVARANLLLDAMPRTHPLHSCDDIAKTRRLMTIKKRLGRIVVAGLYVDDLVSSAHSALSVVPTTDSDSEPATRGLSFR